MVKQTISMRPKEIQDQVRDIALPNILNTSDVNSLVFLQEQKFVDLITLG